MYVGIGGFALIASTHIYIYIYICVCVCVSVCVSIHTPTHIHAILFTCVYTEWYMTWERELFKPGYDVNTLLLLSQLMHSSEYEYQNTFWINTVSMFAVCSSHIQLISNISGVVRWQAMMSYARPVTGRLSYHCHFPSTWQLLLSYIPPEAILAVLWIRGMAAGLPGRQKY